VALFLLERVSPSHVNQVWRQMTTWERHGDVVPLTQVTVVTPPPTREGTVFVARSGIGRLAFDDPMEVVTWRPPTDGVSGTCRLLKRGTFVTGWAEITVHPYGNGGSRVVWQEELRVRRLPTAFDGPLGWVARRMFGRAVDGLLKPS
jgi:hypothetical protein